MGDTRKIIAAFAIDEHIRWASARITGRDIDRESITIGEEVVETQPGVIAEQVTEYVAMVSKNHPEIRQAQGIGISMIGPVDAAKRVVKDVPRKDWRPRKPGGPVMVFDEEFSRKKHKLSYEKLAVQNDATCAALAEWYFREDASDYGLWLYITVNAGINCGVFNVSRPLFQYRHQQPEMGHAYAARHPDDPFDPDKHSGCPSHRWCFEGLASGDAMQKRWGNDWDSDPRAWRLEAFYIGQLSLSAVLAYLPDRLVLGGYVVRRNPDFLPMVRSNFNALNNRFIQNEKVDNLDTYISLGQFGEEANIRGALVLAMDTVVGPPLNLVDRSIARP